jgi:tRNA A37 N6-isopentenylltransferase MiaA
MKIIKLEIKFEVEIEACESIAKQFQLAVDRKITLNWLHCDTEEFGEAFDLILDKALDDNLGLEVKILDIEEWDASIPTSKAITYNEYKMLNPDNKITYNEYKMLNPDKKFEEFLKEARANENYIVD